LNLLLFVVTSQAAYNHFKLVSCLAFTTKHHSSSFSKFISLTKSVFGRVPTATNIPSDFNSFHDFNLTHVIPRVSHSISSTSSFKTISIFSLLFAISTHESSALNVSLL
jgi:hypothetical protein